MELSDCVQTGMTNEDHFLVEVEHAALHVGSGSHRVLATPWMIAFMERVSHRLLARCLPEGYTSVGIWVEVHHLAPTPVGGTIRSHTEVVEVSGERVSFIVQAWDGMEKIGEGRHQRAIIDEARFFRRVERKRESLASGSSQHGGI